MLLGVDRLLISDGARLVLFLPLLVIVLYGLAQSFTNSNPQWWVNHVEDAAGGLPMSTGIYVMSLLMLVADITLLLILLRLMVVTRKIFRLEAEALTTAGMTFNSAHGYTEMRPACGSPRRSLKRPSSSRFPLERCFPDTAFIWYQNAHGSTPPSRGACSRHSILLSTLPYWDDPSLM